jgi:hypothetical protein
MLLFLTFKVKAGVLWTAKYKNKNKIDIPRISLGNHDASY